MSRSVTSTMTMCVPSTGRVCWIDPYRCASRDRLEESFGAVRNSGSLRLVREYSVSGRM